MRLKIQLVKAREAQRNAELRIEHAYQQMRAAGHEPATAMTI